MASAWCQILLRLPAWLRAPSPAPGIASMRRAGSARVASAEQRRGNNNAGLDTDLVIPGRDLLAAGPSAIIGTTVRAAAPGGRLVYRSEGLA